MSHRAEWDGSGRESHVTVAVAQLRGYSRLLRRSAKVPRAHLAQLVVGLQGEAPDGRGHVHEHLRQGAG